MIAALGGDDGHVAAVVGCVIASSIAGAKLVDRCQETVAARLGRQAAHEGLESVAILRHDRADLGHPMVLQNEGRGSRCRKSSCAACSTFSHSRRIWRARITRARWCIARRS
jgi:hypothetical protein